MQIYFIDKITLINPNLTLPTKKYHLQYDESGIHRT